MDTSKGSKTTAGTPASTDSVKDESTKPTPTATADPAPASGAEQPSAPKQADPPAAETPKDQPGTKTAPEADPKESITQAIKDHPVLSHLAGEKKTDDKTKKTTEAKPGEKPDAKAPAKGDKPAAKAAADHDEPPTDPKERNRVFAELRTAAKKLKEVEADAEFGREIADVMHQEGVLDDFEVVTNPQLAGVVRIQAALNRAEHAMAKGGQPTDADKAEIGKAMERLEAVAGSIGLTRGGLALPDPVTGDLPTKWRDLVELGEVSEEDARLFAAVEQAKGKAKATPAPAAKPAATVTTPTSPTPTQRQPTQRPSQSSQPAPTADELAARKLTREHLVQSGIEATRIPQHHRENLLPIVLGELVDPLPGRDTAGTFLSMSPMTQHQLLVIAHDRWKAKQEVLKRPAGEEPGKAGESHVGPLMRRRFGRGLPPTTVGSTAEQQAKSTLAFLAGESQE